MVQLSEEEEQVRPSGDDVTMYPVTGLPPLIVGAAHLMVALPAPATAVAPVGAPGGPFGVTTAERSENAPVPDPLIAAA